MYLPMKLLHVVAVIAFLGNIATGLFWHVHAARTRDARLLAHTMDGIIRSDRLFTIPGVVVIIASGVTAAVIGGLPLLRTGWILWTLVLFGISGLIFMSLVAPLQRRLFSLAQAGSAQGNFDYAGYAKLARRWEFWPPADGAETGALSDDDTQRQAECRIAEAAGTAAAWRESVEAVGYGAQARAGAAVSQSGPARRTVEAGARRRAGRGARSSAGAWRSARAARSDRARDCPHRRLDRGARVLRRARGPRLGQDHRAVGRDRLYRAWHLANAPAPRDKEA
jgi:uncharacterized membrane protein